MSDQSSSIGIECCVVCARPFADAASEEAFAINLAEYQQNPEKFLEKPLQPEKLLYLAAHWAGGIVGKFECGPVPVCRGCVMEVVKTSAPSAAEDANNGLAAPAPACSYECPVCRAGLTPGDILSEPEPGGFVVEQEQRPPLAARGAAGAASGAAGAARPGVAGAAFGAAAAPGVAGAALGGRNQHPASSPEGKHLQRDRADRVPGSVQRMVAAGYLIHINLQTALRQEPAPLTNCTSVSVTISTRPIFHLLYNKSFCSTLTNKIPSTSSPPVPPPSAA